MKSIEITKNSVVVAAHPDDEILWFSSLLLNVEKIVLCYLGELSNPTFGEYRNRALAKFPLKEKIICLNLMALGISRPKNFVSPRFSPFGLELKAESKLPGNGKQHYENNYRVLREKLSDILGQYQNVITHNSWGEYGHEEHVQVYRVVKDLQKSLKFNLWTSNYCSTRTIKLMQSVGHVSQVVTRPTNPQLAKGIMEIYQQEQCWTWYDSWEWPPEETFLMESPLEISRISYGSVMPINLIVKPPLPSKNVRPETTMHRLRKFVGLSGKG